MNPFDWIHSKLSPVGFAKRQQRLDGERSLTKAGYQLWFSYCGRYCEFCNREQHTIALQETKTNPLGEAFTVNRDGMEASFCAYCGYVDVFDSKREAKQRFGFDEMVKAYPPCIKKGTDR